MKSLNLLSVVSDLWGATLGPTEFKIVVCLYRVASATPDGKISRSIEEIAKATGLAWRTVQPKLHDLDSRGVIKILSSDKERMLIEIPAEHWSSRVNDPKLVVEQPASVEELIFRLAGQRPSAQNLAYMKAAAGNDDQRLQACLNSFLLQPHSRWATVDLLVVAVQNKLRRRDFSDSWGRP